MSCVENHNTHTRSLGVVVECNVPLVPLGAITMLMPVNWIAIPLETAG